MLRLLVWSGAWFSSDDADCNDESIA
jgi:hypothetical protein